MVYHTLDSGCSLLGYVGRWETLRGTRQLNKRIFLYNFEKTGHPVIYANIQFNLIFQTTRNMPTYLQIFSEVTALGHMSSGRNTKRFRFTSSFFKRYTACAYPSYKIF